MAHVRERNGTFTITCSLGYDEIGKQIRKYTTFTPPPDVTPGKALKLAQQYAALWEDKLKGYISLDENQNFRKLCDWYYENIAPTVLKETVLMNNRNLLEVYAMPTLGNVKLKNLTPHMLDGFFHELLTNGRVKQLYKLKNIHALDGKKKWLSKEKHASSVTVARLAKGLTAEKEVCERIAAAMDIRFSDMFIDGVESRALSPATVTRVRKNISSILSAAVRKEILTRNPVSKTTPMSVRQEAEAFLDEEQSVILLDALNGCNQQFKTMITTLLFTGMRGGELCGLMWPDVDLENGIIHVRQTLVYSPIKGERTYVLQTPKTKNSKRYIRIPQSLVALLQEHKVYQDKQKALAGNGWFSKDMVFIGATGGFYGEKVLYTQFIRLARKIGLPEDICVHSLRHTTASLLINSDVPPNVISEQLGHANTTITQDLYAHVFASSKIRAMQVLEMKLLKRDGAAQDERP